MKRVLILAANPRNTSLGRLEREVREIDEGMRRAKLRDDFELRQRWAVRPRDVQRAVLDERPNIVHFCGDGAGNPTGLRASEPGRGLILEDEAGQEKLVAAAALAGLFELFSDTVECVLLNACYSEVQAKEISKHIPFVIGMSEAIAPAAALAFAVGFYDALGAGESIKFAFRSACVAIQMEGIPDHLIPVLLKNEALAKRLQTQLKSSADVPHNLPRSSVKEFVGRSHDLTELDRLLQENHQLAIAAVQGMGGIGKSELALQYALEKLRQETCAGGICWIRARETEIGSQIVTFYRSELGLNLPEGLETPEAQVRIAGGTGGQAMCWSCWMM